MIYSKKWRIGLIIIILIYLLYYIFIAENKDIVLVPRKIRHLVKFIITISVYLVGTAHITQFQVKWMEKLWHLIHLSMLGVLLLLGFYVWFISDIPDFVKQFSLTIQELLISPSLYFVMGLLNHKDNTYKD